MFIITCRQSLQARTIYQCTWPGCSTTTDNCVAIESHVRSSHLGPRQIDEEISDHEEEFYYTEVEEEGDEEISDQQSTTLTPMAEVVESSVAQTQSFQQPNATGWMASSPPTLSHMDMARPPHEGWLLSLPDTRNNERKKIKKKN